MRYLTVMAITAATGFMLVWAWVVTMPMAYMDPEYAAWRAKQVLMEHCNLADTLVLGDSRAAADIIPNDIDTPITNLAVGGGEPIEALVTTRAILACPHSTRRVILSFTPNHFTAVDLFWERSVRYGLVSASDLEELRANSRATNDYSLYGEHHVPALPDRFRDGLYRARFPAFEFASLLHAGGFMRWWSNKARFEATLSRRGQYSFGTAAGSDAIAAEGQMHEFHLLPILDFYFDATLARLDAAGIDVWFVAMPVNEATWDAVPATVRNQFITYLRTYEHRYHHFHVMADPMPRWPNRYFGDQFCHLNAEGAARFSRMLAPILHAAMPEVTAGAMGVTRGS
jgi:hypothetical protein